jgi:reverse gyrase
MLGAPDTTVLCDKICQWLTTKVNEHLSGGEWIQTGLLESIKPTKHKVNEHLSGGEWIRTGLLESIKPTKHTTEMFVDLVFSRFVTF